MILIKFIKFFKKLNYQIITIIKKKYYINKGIFLQILKLCFLE